MQIYSRNPPFRLDDFTQSYRVSSQSRLDHLLDGDPTTQWRKLRPGQPERDFDLELVLTHRWDGESYAPKDFSKIEILPCSPTKVQFSVLLRESINVDKELRLPEDHLVLSREIMTQPNVAIQIDLGSKLHLEPSKDYPNGISILVLRAQSHEMGVCLQEVKIIQ